MESITEIERLMLEIVVNHIVRQVLIEQLFIQVLTMHDVALLIVVLFCPRIPIDLMLKLKLHLRFVPIPLP